MTRSAEEFDVMSDIRNEKSSIIKLNEITFIELIIMVNMKTSNGKTDFKIVQGCKTKDHLDSNAVTAW